MKLLKYVIALAFSGALFAQTTTPAAATLFVSTGVQYNKYVPSDPTWATVLNFGTQIAGSNYWSISTMVLQSNAATLRSGFGYKLKCAGAFCFFATIDAGLTNVNGTAAAPTTPNIGGFTLGNVGGGVLMKYDLGATFAKLKGVGIIAGFREAAVAGSNVSPEFTIALGHSF